MNLKPYTFGTLGEVSAAWKHLTDVLKNLASENFRAVVGGWSIVGSSPEVRTIDPTTATAADCAKVLATLIEDLKPPGVIKK